MSYKDYARMSFSDQAAACKYVNATATFALRRHDLTSIPEKSSMPERYRYQ